MLLNSANSDQFQISHRFQGDAGAQGVPVGAARSADGALPGERQRDARPDRGRRGRPRHVDQARSGNGAGMADEPCVQRDDF